MAIRYICEICGAGFDKPFPKLSYIHIDGRVFKDREELCPVCFNYYFSPADLCQCGRPKRKGDHLCGECLKDLFKRFDDFADGLTEEEEDQIDDWLDGMSIKSRKTWPHG